MSKATLVRAAATDLTASLVYSDPVPVSSNTQHSLLVEYDPDTDSTNALEVVVQISYDEVTTAAASSDWINVGTLANSTGTLTFTASTLSMPSGAAATYAHWDITNTLAKKMRVGVKETNAPGDYGNATIWLFSSKA